MPELPGEAGDEHGVDVVAGVVLDPHRHLEVRCAGLEADVDRAARRLDLF